MKRGRLLPLLTGIVMSIAMVGCHDDYEPKPRGTTIIGGGYTVPSTYDFENVDYSGQTTRLIMLDSLSIYMKKGNAGGMPLDANHMKAMYANSGNPFGNPALDASGKQLKNKTYAPDQFYFDNLFDSLAIASQSFMLGSNGTAGIVFTNDGAKSYLFNENGVEYNQLITKQLMGAVFYYQAIETYLAALPTDDNTTITPGQGTTMEHHTDEAFGYLGVPVDFPANKTGLKYWGSYSNQVDPAISSNAAIMNAFLKLRAAVANKDNATRDAQIIVVRQEWEKIVAASAILELTAAKANLGDNAYRMHYLSEGLGFIKSLKYNSNKMISQAKIDEAIAALGNNFYNISSSQISTAINAINSAYGFDLNKF